VVLARHGVTDHTVAKRFSGDSGTDPGLTDEGRAQVRATADWLCPIRDGIDVVLSSPVRRTRESAEILGARLGREVAVEPGLAEMDFATWEGLTFAEVRERQSDDLDRWLGSLDHPRRGRVLPLKCETTRSTPSTSCSTRTRTGRARSRSGR